MAPPKRKQKAVKVVKRSKKNGKKTTETVGTLRSPRRGDGPPLDMPFEEAFEIILERIEAGETLVDILPQDREARKGLPALRTVYNYLDRDADLAKRYTASRQIQMHVWADQTIVIADRGLPDDPLHPLKKPLNTPPDRKLQVDVRWRLMQTVARGAYAPPQQVHNETTLKGSGENGAIKIETDLRVLPPDLAVLLHELSDMHAAADEAEIKREAEIDERERRAEAAGKKVRRD